MALRIAFDMDGVFADMDGELLRQAEQLFGPGVGRRREPAREAIGASDQTNGRDVGAAAADETGAGENAAAPEIELQLSARQQRKLWRHVETIENFWETLDELEPGVIARLATVVAERRWEVIFLTKRPESAGVTAQVQTQRWLAARGFPMPSVFVVQGSRGRIAASLGIDFVIDDRPENCLDVVTDSKARAILVSRDPDKPMSAATRRLGIGVVKTVADVIDILVQADTPAPGKPGMMDRVKQLLGLGELTPSR